MKQLLMRLGGQLKNHFDNDPATKDRPLPFQIITFMLLLAIVSFLVFGIINSFYR